MTGLCAKLGCTKTVFIEPRTNVAHKYCGRSHAVEAEGQVRAPHGRCQECNLLRCHKPVAFDATSGRVHDFCRKEHADEAMRNGQWQWQGQGQLHRKRDISQLGHGQAVTLCSLFGCSRPVFNDNSGRTYDFCGRTHAVQYRQEQVQAQLLGTNSSRSSSSSSSSSSSMRNSNASTSTPGRVGLTAPTPAPAPIPNSVFQPVATAVNPPNHAPQKGPAPFVLPLCVVCQVRVRIRVRIRIRIRVRVMIRIRVRVRVRVLWPLHYSAILIACLISRTLPYYSQLFCTYSMS